MCSPHFISLRRSRSHAQPPSTDELWGPAAFPDRPTCSDGSATNVSRSAVTCSNHANDKPADGNDVRPSHGGSSYVRSSHGGSSYGGPSHVRSTHVRPSHVRSTHGGRSHGGPSHGGHGSTLPWAVSSRSWRFPAAWTWSCWPTWIPAASRFV